MLGILVLLSLLAPEIIDTNSDHCQMWQSLSCTYALAGQSSPVYHQFIDHQAVSEHSNPAQL
jgi:hypothetical protein